MNSMTKSLSITIIDDDQSVRESLLDLLEVFGYSVRTFASANEFLDSSAIPETNCLLLDISMPGMGGVDLNLELKRREIEIPVVFMTGHAQDAVINEAKKAGTCLFKPFASKELRSAIELAVNP
ncbi:response regulator [Sinorhizobium meliloti]|uniref:response regulator transcription factor n=1 Tax=Rhizobium meliloti TaxID=382 RepID=UPI000FD5BA5A|nr:response regulator [Sinorhizobium meliloti]MDW9416397.1 response regulator [Sinorhizobium meliloti]MDW9482453.1 response regulator [Sinorhizobium meliloti]MDW9513290.1 response regulator [Sinorhizobium meliloti]MDW9637373.1 response regulator [Sinorhizobium meliloti]MDW9669809.1 response regulator [Sinorhizobium meliloti]